MAVDCTQPILVTGAAGSVGAVGRRVVELLLERGHRVRAQVRTDDQRAAALRSLGAEVSVGDLLELDALHREIEGCERIYFGMSVSASYLEATANIAAVARHHTVTWLDNAAITSGPLFRPIRKGDRLVDRRLTDKSVAAIVKRWAVPTTTLSATLDASSIQAIVEAEREKAGVSAGQPAA